MKIININIYYNDIKRVKKANDIQLVSEVVETSEQLTIEELEKKVDIANNKLDAKFNNLNIALKVAAGMKKNGYEAAYRLRGLLVKEAEKKAVTWKIFEKVNNDTIEIIDNMYNDTDYIEVSDKISSLLECKAEILPDYEGGESERRVAVLIDKIINYAYSYISINRRLEKLRNEELEAGEQFNKRQKDLNDAVKKAGNIENIFNGLLDAAKEGNVEKQLRDVILAVGHNTRSDIEKAVNMFNSTIELKKLFNDNLKDIFFNWFTDLIVFDTCEVCGKITAGEYIYNNMLICSDKCLQIAKEGFKDE